mmetsp:Transcript_131570/g.380590  ORF Transcript_131570/g.380590 Transcript_131570/m.380590 type:complete len:1115 (+) Transcript_131570:85-3429(+)
MAFACCGASSIHGKRSIALANATKPSVTPDVNGVRGGRPNQISTARFPSPVVVTWLPKSLFSQFMRAANIFFLGVSILVCMPFSPTAWSSTALPFAGVLLWTALKDLYEDMRRRRDDIAENLRKCWRFDFVSGKFRQVPWQEVLCGDVVLTLQDEVFPADLLILSASSGRAFISTANLDGETNLKERRPPAACLAALSTPEPSENGEEVKSSGSLTMIVAEGVANEVFSKALQCNLDEPKVGFDDMGGTASFKAADGLDHGETVLYADHFCPRGCVLRNTTWLVSIVAYVGNETKSRLNVATLDSKISNLQVYLNSCVKGLVSTLVVFCLYASIMAQIFGDDDSVADFFVRFCKYWIILYQIVPISLYVCFEIVKLLLGAQINMDEQMADPDTGLHAVARTADLVEELGQVQHIFTDKTGTITQNEMRFARCCVNGQDMGEFRPPPSTGTDNCATTAAPLETEGVAAVRRILQDKSSKAYEDMRRFFLCLAACHSAQVETGKSGEIVYTSSSPDEVAFLDAARSVGMVLRAQRLTPREGIAAVEMQIESPDGVMPLTVLSVVPFSSERKRMSVVCEVDGELLCITKGADSIMGPLCNGTLGDSVMKQIDTYAKLGLRTLVVGWKSVDRSFLSAWQVRMENARGSSIEVREEKLAQCARELEHSLRLSGVSAIEDRLQDGVPVAMSTLKAMGIRIWVLTGDKVETAVEIARSCRLLGDTTALISITNAASSLQAVKLLREGKDAAKANLSGDCTLILDGSSMKYATDSVDGARLIFEVGALCRTCICCRLAPQQKRRLVQIVREADKERITLSIGDGANDVPMIQGAHVGIGVRGKEGSQAVQASDIAISQFRFLVPLLQCHGRRAYRRVATFLCYYVYKHVALAVGDMCWAHQSEFAGKVAYPEWVSSAYAAFFTTVPVIGILSFDRDLPDSSAFANPELYAEGQSRIHFNSRIFTIWMLSGVWHGALSWFVPNLAVGASDPGEDPEWNKDWWTGSLASFTLVLVCVSFRLWMIALNRTSAVTLASFLISFVFYLVTMLMLSHTFLGEIMQPQIQGSFADMFASKEAMLALFLSPLALSLDLIIFVLLKLLRPTPLDCVISELKAKRSRVQAIS